MNKTIWTPTGTYEVGNRDIELLDYHARLYDDKLSVRANPRTGDICLFREQKDGSTLPVYGWQRIPTIDQLQERLYKTDIQRHGVKILEDAWAEADRRKLEDRKEADEAIEHTAEVLEFEFRER